MTASKSQAASPRPDWFLPERIRWCWWNWEPDSARIRLGYKNPFFLGNVGWRNEWNEKLFANETIDKLAAMGMNLAITHFYKGMGLVREQEEMTQIADFVERCHRRGVRVIGYAQIRSLYYETLAAEKKDLDSWAQRNYDGSIGLWANVYYRWAPCLNARPWRDYIKNVLTYGAREIGLDGFHFDNCYTDGCYCPRCREAFREYLSTVDDRRELLGFSNVEHVLPPPIRHTARIQEPLAQLWIRYNTGLLAETMKEFYSHIKSLDQNLLVIGNPAFPRRAGWAGRLSLDPSSIGEWLDAAFAENGCFPHMNDGRRITQERAHRYAKAGGYSILATSWLRQGGLCPARSEHEIALSLFEEAARGGVVGTNWALRTEREHLLALDDPSRCDALRKGLAFLEEHQEIYDKAEPLEGVAMVHSFESHAFAPTVATVANEAAEQLLLEQHVPYSVIYANNLEQLNDFSAALVIEQICLSDAQCQTLIDFVHDGGRLILSENTAGHDENGIPRRVPGLAVLEGHPRVRNLGAVEVKRGEEPDQYIRVESAALPSDPAPLEAALKDAWPEAQRPFHAEAPNDVGVHFRRLPNGACAIHLLHYDLEGIPSAVRIGGLAADALKRLKVVSPWEIKTRTTQKDITVTQWKIYAVLYIPPARNGAADE